MNHEHDQWRDAHRAKSQAAGCRLHVRYLITVTPEDTIVHCIALTKKHHVRHLPVVKEGKALGMISLRDLFLDVIEEIVGVVGEDE